MTEDRSGTLRRRDVMRVAGTAAVGSVALSGTVSAHEADCVYFCGCGRMVAYRRTTSDGLPDRYPVFVAKEGGGPDAPTLDHYFVEGEDRNVHTTQRGRGKILAFGHEDGDENAVYLNPDQCARNVFDEYGGPEQTIDDYLENYDNDDWPDDVKFYPERENDFSWGQEGHCHPPRDDHHCNHDRGSDSNGQSDSNGRSNGRRNGR